MVEIDWSQMPQGATAKFLRTCLVADETGKTQLYDQWVKELGKPHLVMEKLEQIPNSIADYIVKKCREISGMTDGEEADDSRPKKRELINNPRLLFAHRLIAAGIGGQTVFYFNCLLNGVDPNDVDLDEKVAALQDEFFRWQAYDQIFPIGYEDLHTARFMRLFAEANTPKGKGRPKIEDFLLGELPKLPKSANELEEKMNVWFNAQS